MARRHAVITQAEIARAIRAAKQEGAAEVELRPDGGICVRMTASSPLITARPLDPSRPIVL